MRRCAARARGPTRCSSRRSSCSSSTFAAAGRFVLPSIAVVNNWSWWGFLVVVFLAAMQSVDPALYEAAALDGAGRWRQFLHVTLPGIRPTFLFLGLMTVVWSFLIFDYVYILTDGGPGGSSEVLGPPGRLVLGLLGLFALGPLVLFAFNSLKTRSELAGRPFGPPTGMHRENFGTAWRQANMAAGMQNSAIVVLATVAGVWVLSGPAAYALSRMNMPRAGGIVLYLVVGGALPTQMFLVPLFLLWARLGLLDSLFGLIVVYWALFSPFATLLTALVSGVAATGARGSSPDRRCVGAAHPDPGHSADRRARFSHGRTGCRIVRL